jgi:anti-sigma factor RsiW
MTEDEEKQLTEADALLDEAEALIWALLDDQIESADQARLTKLLETEPAVRARYLDCVQLHVDLLDHFDRRPTEKKPGAVVLSNLMTGLPGAQGFTQTTQ